MAVPAREEIAAMLAAGEPFGRLIALSRMIGGRYDATKVMRAATASFGFDAFMIADVAAAGSHVALRDLVRLSTWPRDLIDAYDEMRLLRSSLVAERIRGTTLPVWWDVRTAPPNERTGRAAVATELFVDHGLPCHLVLSVADASGGRLTVSFSGRRDEPSESEAAQLMRIGVEVVERLRMCEPATHGAMDADAVALTVRQAEALAWVADGKTSSEAAAIMGITGSTVDGYLEAVLDRLGATTRAQAVAKAVRAGLI